LALEKTKHGAGEFTLEPHDGRREWEWIAFNIQGVRALLRKMYAL
jgi:hypothetical protein